MCAQLVLASDHRHLLLALAEELLVLILLDLEPRDILSCTKVCHALADVVERTPAVQYKLQLGLAGMIDGLAALTPVGQRLEQLRAYQSSWSENAVPIVTVNCSRQYRCFVRDGAVAYVGSTHLKLFRPASAYSGIAEEELGTLEFGHHVDPDSFSVDGLAIDREQDLVILTQLLLGEMPHMYLLSISNGGALHPLAARPHLEGAEELGISIDPEEQLDICGDHVAWTIQSDAVSIIVYNWKTGQIVWTEGEWPEGDPHFYMRCHFLDRDHLLVVRNTDLHVHQIDPAKAGAWNAYTNALCMLRFPALRQGLITHGMESQLRCPTNFPGDKPLFQRNPPLSVLAVKFSACKDPHGYNHSQCRSFIALVPVATILATLKDTPSRFAEVPWEAWSAPGARIIEHVNDVNFSIHTMGSTCMLIPQYSSTSGITEEAKNAFLIDAHPLAKDAPCAKLGIANPTLKLSDTIHEPEWFEHPVHSTLPYRIRALGEAPGSCLSHDAIVKLQYGSYASDA
ncbi:hypothetical protein BN946_scf184746.g3 [Trametes cinnabarina]|uniref:F-box domain-containing protein n=1 Tax=Pycnoporus cinnabarinus TaxID=5643 RepID=A0A060S4I5_PYCCI|nr:hypothetical protein BN946_scf184746.g3 [Trametes cinnabarina]